MAEVINLPARYGYTHRLVKVDDKKYQLQFDKKSTGTYRRIGFENQSPMAAYIYAIDPEGGPFLAVGTEIEGNIIKSIMNGGIIEFE